MERLIDPLTCKRITDKHPDYFTFNVEEWFANADNFCLQEGDNVAFAEYKSPGVYWVHFCFDKAKGRQAIDLTKKIYNTFCCLKPVKLLIGLIHVNNKKAKWLIRQVGWQSLGLIETKNGLCEMFYTKGNH